MSDDIRLIHGDCLEILPTLETGSFDAVVTDPPFGVRGEAWDDMDAHEFARFSMAWLSQARRIAPDLVVFCTQDSPVIDLCRMIYSRVRTLIWYKPRGSQYAGASDCGLWYSFEVILHCHDRKPWSVTRPKSLEVARMIRKAREAAGLSRGAVEIATRGKKTGLCYRWEEGSCLPTPEQVVALEGVMPLGYEFREAMRAAEADRAETISDARAMASAHAARDIDVFEHRTVTAGRHPCEKPSGLMDDILATIGKDYRSVIDPFAGSGATLKACQKAGVPSTGIEKDPAYVAAIRRSLESAATPLFAEAR